MPERDVMTTIAALRTGAAGAGTPSEAVGRVVSVNVSSGGVPKRAISEAFVTELGLENDFHDSPSHGGPLRAVSLLAIEAIRRVAAEGNPIAPGTTGENVTTEGIELAALSPGAQLAIGDEVIVEMTQHVTPCKTIAGSFLDGHFERLSAKLHPLDARIYASVVREGTIRPGDPIQLLTTGNDAA
jgi:MOSC domain-containing protein YiiM